jgi:outer membrane receptor protein involved in Fe transport
VPSMSRVLSTIGLFVLIGGPLSMAPAWAQSTEVAQSAPAATSQVSGLVTDTTGAPVAGAVITLNGPHSYSATSDSQGRYTIAAVVPGTYVANVTRVGYQTGTEQDLAIVAGSPVTLNVQLAAPTLTTLRTIGSTRTVFSRSTFNTSPAAVNVVSTQTFIDQGQPQVKSILNETPGIVASLPATSGNGAAAGAITFPNIRGGLSFETASLIDGHPVSVGAFGDYVTTFLNAFTLGSVEVIKGPGASAPEVNYAIGGTVNFRTLDPSRKPTGYQTIGMDSFGGVFSNFGYSNTIMNGKLGFVLDYGVNGTPGPLQNYATATPMNRAWQVNGQAITGTITTSPPIPGTTQTIFNGTATLLYSGIPVSTTYTNKTELVKLKYNFSPSTSLTASYLGSQTWTEQNGNHFYQYTSTFNPAASYSSQTGPQPGPILAEDNIFAPPHEWEINNEPIFQAELRTSLGTNNILARAYTASINRLQYNGLNSPAQPAVFPAQLWGTATVGGVAQTYNGQNVTLTVPGAYFNSSEEDRLRGYSLEVDHPFGDTGNMISLAVDQTHSTTGSYNVGTFIVGSLVSGTTATVPPTSGQTFTTILARGIWNLGSRMNLTWSNYFNTYQTHYSLNNGGTFIDQNNSHFDSRLGLTYRVNPDISLRGAAGSAIAPPYIALYSKINTAPTLVLPAQQIATNTTANPNLRPETSFGYDFGGDIRFGQGKQTVFSLDLYTTTLWNQLISTSEFANGNVTLPSCLAGQSGAKCTGPPVTVPLFSSGSTNLAQAGYSGIEFQLRRDPTVGFGFALQGALMRATPMNVPASFYTVPGGTTPVRNLGVIPGINFLGASQGVSNQPVPYSNGYGEIHYRTARGAYVSFGETYYGDNNSLFLPAFFIANANGSLPLGTHGLSFNVNIDNVFNTNGNNYITEYGGIFQPYINGAVTTAGVPLSGFQANANTYGPRNVRVSFSYKLGS